MANKVVKRIKTINPANKVDFLATSETITITITITIIVTIIVTIILKNKISFTFLIY